MTRIARLTLVSFLLPGETLAEGATSFFSGDFSSLALVAGLVGFSLAEGLGGSGSFLSTFCVAGSVASSAEDLCSSSGGGWEEDSEDTTTMMTL